MKKLIKKLRICYNILKSDDWIVSAGDIVSIRASPSFWNKSARQLNDMSEDAFAQNAAVDEVNSILNNK
jgi:hypothetical protein